MTVLMQFTSHISGKNAEVIVHETHIEWTRQGHFGMGKATLAVATGGLSLAAKSGRTGGRGAGTEMIPLKAVTSVTTRRDGFRNSIVSIIAAGSTIDMRVSHAEAEQVKGTLTRLMIG